MKTLFGYVAAALVLFIIPAGAQNQPPAERRVDARELAAKLVNRTKAREGKRVLQSAAARDATLLDGVKKVELVKFFDAAVKPMQHRDSKPTKYFGAYSDHALAGKTRAIMTWGPYLPFDAGRYLVVYRFQYPQGARGDSVGFLDVAHKAVTYSGKRPRADEIEEEKWNEIAIPIDTPKKMQFEFRFWPFGWDAVIDRIYVYRLHFGKELPVSVMGAVAKPGFHWAPAGKDTVRELIKMAGGLNGNAHKGTFKVWQRMKRRGNITETISFDIEQNAAESNASVPPGTLIWIPEHNTPKLMD